MQLVSHVGQQGDVPCALDGDGQLTLMGSAGTGGTAGQDLAALGQVTAELSGILVVDVLDLIDAEGTNLLPLVAWTSLIVHHNEVPPIFENKR